MLVVGLSVIAVSTVGLIIGWLIMSNMNFHGPFEEPAQIEATCDANYVSLSEKKVSEGVPCGILVKDADGKPIACRRGQVNANGNLCVADTSILGPGLIVSCAIAMLCGIVLCFVTPKHAKHTKHHHHKK